MNGEGKGWAKGRTAATDPRIARSAAAHRGMTYVHRLPPEFDRRHIASGHRGNFIGARTLPLEWSPTMAYVVGLMATDGCLSSSNGTLTFGSSDKELVLTLISCLGLRPTHETIVTPRGSLYYRRQFGDIRFHRWLRSIGLTPRKSLVLGAIDVPDEYLFALSRGLLDGDGSLLNFWYDGGGKAAGKRYEGFVTRFVSASRSHLEWLQRSLERLAAVRGAIAPSDDDRGCWALNYAIGASTNLLPRIYPTEDVPKLERKWSLWKRYAERHGHPPTLHTWNATPDGEAEHKQRPNRDPLGRFQTLSLKEESRPYRAH